MQVVEFLFYDLFPQLLQLAQRILVVFGSSVRELTSEYLNITLPDWSIFNTPLLLFMIGSGIILFCVLTLVKWVIGIVL